jgi:oxygen-independent coproporphyrinogen-3 oxidase
MFALPGQTLDGWRRNLDAAAALEPQHVSAYNLTFEEDTEFLSRLESGEFKADGERDAAFFELTVSHLAPLGFEAYEISNFARPGWQSLHNRAYWEGKDYLGFGPGACSTVGMERHTNTGDVEAYCRETAKEGRSPREVEPLSPHVRRVERIVLGLRTSRGVALAELEPWRDEVARLKEEGWLRTDGGRAVLTPQGRLVADSIAEIFV